MDTPLHRALLMQLSLPAWCCDDSGQPCFCNPHFKPDMLAAAEAQALWQDLAAGRWHERQISLQREGRTQTYRLICTAVRHPQDRVLCYTEALTRQVDSMVVINQMLISSLRERDLAVRDLRQTMEQLASIIAVQQRLAQAELDLSRFNQLVAEELCRLTGAAACCIHLLGGTALSLQATHGDADILARLTPWCAAQQPARLQVRQDLAELPGSIILAPIVHAGQKIGMATIYCPTERSLDAHDLQTVELLAGLLGSAYTHQSDFEISTRLIDERTAALAALNAEVERRRQSEAALLASESRLQEIIEASHEGYLSFDPQGRINMLNAEAAQLLGGTKPALVGRALHDFLQPASADVFCRALRIYSRRKKLCWLKRRHELLMCDLAGNAFIAEASFSATGSAEQIEFHAFLHDITRRKEAEAALRRSQALLRSVADSIPVHLAYIDAQQRYLYTNSALGTALGLAPEQIVGLSMIELLGVDTYQLCRAQIEAALRGEHVQGEMSLQTRQGVRRFESRLIPVTVPASGLCSGFYMVAWDIEERWRETSRLRDAASRDALTGLFNRPAFFSKLEEHLGMDNSPAHALLYIDLDNFKNINDAYGHAVGDSVLQVFSERLNSCVRADDCICRIGGDEFLVLLKNAGSAEPASRITRKILEAMHEPVVLDGLRLHVSLSVGIALHDGEHGESAQDLIARADAALYRAKAAGRSGYAIA